MRVLVCGGRDFENAELLDRKVREAIGHVRMTPPVIIHGGAKGADTLAGDWAKVNGVECEVYPADWSKNGRAAGSIRNRQMIVEGRPDVVVALPGGRGTQNMVKQSIAAGLTIYFAAGASQ